MGLLVNLGFVLFCFRFCLFVCFRLCFCRKMPVITTSRLLLRDFCQYLEETLNNINKWSPWDCYKDTDQYKPDEFMFRIKSNDFCPCLSSSLVDLQMALPTSSCSKTHSGYVPLIYPLFMCQYVIKFIPFIYFAFVRV